MGKKRPVLLFCRVCDTGYASIGEVPTICPNSACRSTKPNWTTTPPYRLTVNDKSFLRSIRITQE